MAVTTFGTTLEWGTSAETTTAVVEIYSFPDLGAEPTMHDVSTFMDKISKQILGRQELAGLTFNYYPDATATNFKAVKDDEGKELFYKLKFGPAGDGSMGVFEWKGQHVTWFDGQEGDGPITASLTIAPSTEISFE